ncbi:MAG: efflux RND transporter permease subunit [Erysipelotrichia bacterium]|nr:efflux RND transporter permease subunit [Erysipelotrichia bacterium]
MILTQYSLKNRLSVAAIAFTLLVLGLYGLSSIPVDLLPSITYPMVKVHIWWRGATPDEIDKNLADPIERQMATVDDLDYLESSSIEGMYTLLVNFKYGVDVNVGYQDVLAAMARAARQLPTDIEPPVIIKADPSQLPVLQMTISSEKWDLTRLRTWTDEWLSQQVLSVPGVAGSEIVGGLKREIRIHLDADALEKYGLTVPQIVKRLNEENVEQFSGRITVGPKEIIARTMGEFASLDEIKNIVMINNGVTVVKLEDVAEVSDSHEEARVITRLNGKPCVKLNILKQSSANTVEVSLNVARRMEELAKIMPEEVTLGVLENQAQYIQDAINSVKSSAFEAAILVIIVVWLFLGSFRQVLVILVALPLTLIFNFGLMKIAGFSLNIFSLGGLVVAIGVLVDNSIIVIESVAVRRKLFPDENTDQAIEKATSDIGPAIVAATLSFLALFLPFLLVPGLLSLLFNELIMVIAGIVIISLLVAITLTPSVTGFLTAGVEHGSTRFTRFFDRVSEYYGKAVDFFCRRSWSVLAVFVLTLVIAGIMINRTGTEFLPKMDDGMVMVKVKLPTGASLAQTNQVLAEIEKKIADNPLIETIFTLSGGKVWGLYTYEIANEGELNIQLVPQSKRKLSTDQFVAQIRPLIMQVPVPGGMAMVSKMKMKGIRKLGDADIEIKIKGDDIPTLFSSARKYVDALSNQKNLTNINLSLDMNKPEFQVFIDRQKAADRGVTVAEAARTLRSLVTGTVATRYRDGSEYYNIRVMIPENRMVSQQDLELLPVTSSSGKVYKLSDIASVKQAFGPVEIIRDDQIKQVIVRADAAGTSVGQALAELKTAVEKIKLPSGYTVSFGGEAQMIADMVSSVTSIMLFAVFFSFVVLTVQFNSLKLPTIILGSVPFCVAGVFFVLMPTGFPAGATVLIGVLVVIAAAVNDGVLLLTFAEELRESEGLPIVEAVVKAAKVRLRPRVMTTASVLTGFIPMAVSSAGGGGMLQPMAIAAIGGLSMEMLVAMFLMPCLYVIVTSREKSSSKQAQGSN